MNGPATSAELICIEHVINSYGSAVDEPDFGFIAACFTDARSGK